MAFIYEQAPEHSRRIENGDDFSGDAWRHIKTGHYQFVGIGVEIEQEQNRPGLWYKETANGLERVN